MCIAADPSRYLGQLVQRLREVLADRLSAVYALGSLALGGFEGQTSDIDVYAITTRRLASCEKVNVACACSHSALACPARKLELVVVSAAVARAPGTRPRWELNLNTGPGQADHVGLDPDREPSHWFVLDLAIAYQRALPLVGPPARDLIGPPLTADVARAQNQAIRWYARHGTPEEHALAVRRARIWSQTGRFVSKRQAHEGS